MRTHTFDYMLLEYESNKRPVELDDIEERLKFLTELKYSIIVEGDFLEFESLEKWIKENILQAVITQIFYAKTDYDFGFMEYFFEKEDDKNKVEKEIPNIYTLYANGICRKSDGNDNAIEFNSVD